MIISFIGSPSSGKTTTAALTFGKLKEYGVLSEFIPEQARWYIAEKRVKSLKLPAGTPITLDDIDQFNIIEKQIAAEQLMFQSCGKDVVLISDSSHLNTLLYMSEDYRNSELVTPYRNNYKYDINFYCPPVEQPKLNKDPNRLHNIEQSNEIDKQIPIVLKDFELFQLYGKPAERAEQAVSEILTRMVL